MTLRLFNIIVNINLFGKKRTLFLCFKIDLFMDSIKKDPLQIFFTRFLFEKSMS